MSGYKGKARAPNAALANSGQPWREEDYALMINEYVKGGASDETAAKLKRTTLSVEMQMARKISEMVDEKNSIEDLCQRYHYDINLYRKFQGKKVESAATAIAAVLNMDNAPNTTTLLTEIRDLLAKIELNTRNE